VKRRSEREETNLFGFLVRSSELEIGPAMLWYDRLDYRRGFSDHLPSNVDEIP
jgi:hypothetical protein